ncbi:MAG: aminotransferase DegT [Firmicutes bacterium HGW-Firmicutes-1]|jgi:dTDP-4-amino-4,6-dideoxygalactose transaminase|nr:MAG: aminotransferase DegT [Firmicutes bacterium HGW-Firmicutes-1]
MINVTKTYLPEIERYKEYIQKIYDKAWLTNNGEFVRELEIKLSKHLGVRNILLVANGTLALQIAYKALALSGEVITTPFSFVATTSSLVWEGLTPIFADIDSDTFNIDPEKIESKITDKTSCIVPTHVFGNGCNVEAIDELSKKHNLRVVYDGAHAFGINYKDNSILNYGDISILSFHATKLFHTIEGGALIINNDSLYEKVKLMINFGIKAYEEIDGLGINGKMNEFQAAMGLCVLEDIDRINEKRKKIFEHYKNHLNNCPHVRLQKHNEFCNMNYGYFPVVFNTEEDLNKVVHSLNDHQVIPRRYFYPSLDRLPYVEPSDNPISNDIASRILCLPIYEALELKDVDKIIDIILTCIKCS